jgi:hypothetical protein
LAQYLAEQQRGGDADKPRASPWTLGANALGHTKEEEQMNTMKERL